MKKTLLIIASAFTLLSCTDNQRARTFGGTETINLPINCKYLGSTWKGEDLWISYIDTITGLGYLKEKSSWGVIEGTVIIKPNPFSADKDTMYFKVQGK